MKKYSGLAAILVFLGSTTAWASGVEVKEQWVREAPPGMKMLAGYMVIKNETGKELVFTGASSPAFGSIELHHTVIKDGMARMIQQKSVRIPAHSKFEFKPKGYHLMLMQPKRDLREGEKVMITLKFRNRKNMMVNYPVRKAAGGMMNHDHKEEMHETHEGHHEEPMHQQHK